MDKGSRPLLSAAEVSRACGLDYAPTPEQEAIITAPLTSMLVVAGAGSGKTETMAARVVWLIANNLVAPEEVLGLTFTRKAASELGERIGNRLRALSASGVWQPTRDDLEAEPLQTSAVVSTYHSYAGRIVREHGVLLGREPDSRMLSEAAAWQHAAEIVQRYDGPMDEIDAAESTIITAVLDLAGELAEHLRTTDEVREELDRIIAELEAVPARGGKATLTSQGAELLKRMRGRRALLPLVDAFAELKRSRDAMDFADQVALAARLAREVPRVGALERDRFRVVLLDEFQDTSEAQLELLAALFAPRPDDPDLPDVPVTAVGDPHQSIYGWRGASATTLSRFPQVFGPGGAASEERAPVLPLATSWRNDAQVLRVANAVAQPLREASRVEVSELGARPGAGEGHVTSARLGTHLEEADHIARWLVEVASDRTAAVLCRKRSQFSVIMDALDRHGVPYEVVGLGGLLLTPEVEDVVALLRVAQDPVRGDALMRLLTGPVCRLGAADLDGLMAWARARHGDHPRAANPDLAPDTSEMPSIVEALDDLPDSGWCTPDGRGVSDAGLRRLQGLAAAVRRVRAQAGLPLADLVGEAERALGIDVEVLSRPGYGPAAARAHLDALADVATGFTASADRPTLPGFLAWLDAALQEERGLEAGIIESTPGAVQILTVHAAKGLEWDCVAVPGLVEGTFPARDSASPRWEDGAWLLGPATTTGWSGGWSALPYSLRGDVDGLPVLHWSGATSPVDLNKRCLQFRADAGAHAMTEERRLAYVAFTRARRRLLLTSHVWGTQKTPRVAAGLLTEVIDETHRGPWAEMPEGPKPEAPDLGTSTPVLWPLPRDAQRVRTLEAAAQAVRTTTAQGLPDSPTGRLAALLLAERAREMEARGRYEVERPTHLSASEVVALARDPRAFAEERRRPMPQPPAAAARAGTAFHAWVEAHFRRAAFVDVDELPGSADEDAAPVADLPRLKEHFLASEWASQTPVEIEMPIETVIDGVAVRGRIDAVFPREDGGFTVVDWKTGRPPTGDEGRLRRLQLSVYATAYAALRGIDPALVDGAFFHASTGETVRPELPHVSDALQQLPVGSLDAPE